MLGSFYFFGKEIGYYTLMALIGALAAGFFCYNRAKRKKLDEVKMIFLLLFSMIGVFLGAHFVFGLTNIQYFQLFAMVENFGQFIYVVSMIFGGQVFYGGLLGGIAAGAIYSKITHLDNFGGYTDCAAPAVPLFHFFGRIGCFLGGCCYGIESEFGFTFTHSLVESANGVRRFPVQLFEAGFNLLLFFLLFIMLKKEKLKGRLFLLYLGLYAPVRFGLEFLRGDTYRGYLFGLSTSQIISLGIMLVLAVYTLIKKLNKKSGKQSS